MGVQAAGDRMVSGQPLILAAGLAAALALAARPRLPCSAAHRQGAAVVLAVRTTRRGKADWMDSWWHLGDTPYIFNER